MRELKTTFGLNAGKIWSVLNEKPPQKKNEIVKTTKLNDNDFYAAVGWLAREDKISEEPEEHYKIDNTNLTSEIGSNAGRIWRILDIWEEVDLSVMQRLSGLETEELYSALGWLAREDKIVVDEKHRFKLK